MTRINRFINVMVSSSKRRETQKKFTVHHVNHLQDGQNEQTTKNRVTKGVKQ